MPDIPDRDVLETEFARKLGRLFGGFSGHLLELLEEYNWDIFAIPESVWKTAITRPELAVLLPFLERVAIASAEQLMGTVGIGVDWALVNQVAADWARSYSVLLAGQIDQTSRGAIATSIRNSVASYFEEGLSQAELVRRLEADEKLARLFTKDVKDRLGRVYGPQRAEMIAITETTRAKMEGEQTIISELADQGVHMKAIWDTANDDRVCEICGPMHGREADSYDMKRRPYWIHPTTGKRVGREPLHPRCRCGVRDEAY